MEVLDRILLDFPSAKELSDPVWQKIEEGITGLPCPITRTATTCAAANDTWSSEALSGTVALRTFSALRGIAFLTPRPLSTTKPQRNFHYAFPTTRLQYTLLREL